MADTEIVKILLQLENPAILERIEKAKADTRIKFTADLGKGFQELFELSKTGTKINITANTDGAIASLSKIKSTLESFKNVSTLNLNLGGNLEKDLEKVSNMLARLELQAKNINTVGISNAQIKAYQQNPALLDQAMRSFSSSAFSKPNSIQQSGPQGLDQAIASAVARNNQRMADMITRSDPFQAINSVQVRSAADITRLRNQEMLAQGRQQNQFLGGLPQAISSSAIDPFLSGNQIPLGDVNATIRTFNNREKAIAQYRSRVAKAEGSPLTLGSLFGGFKRELEEGAGLSAFSNLKEGLGNKLKGLDGSFSSPNLPQQKAAALGSLKEQLGLSLLAGRGTVGTAGQLIGGIAGAAGGPGGILLGAGIGGAVAESAVKSFEKVGEALALATDAGLKYRESILSITAVYQATTQVTTGNGTSLGTSDQLLFQQGRAEKTQQLARRELIPLGITGEKEASLVRAIIAGAAQRGIQFSPEQIATLSRRFGGAIQVQRPDLFNNFSLVTRDIEDFFSQPGRNTVFKSIVRGFTPGSENATSAEDFIRKTQKLEAFPQALTSQGLANPNIAFAKFNGAVDQLLTNFGDKLLKGFVGPLTKVADILLDPELVKSLNSEEIAKISETFANLGVGVVKSFADMAKGIAGFLNDPAVSQFISAVNKESVEFREDKVVFSEEAPQGFGAFARRSRGITTPRDAVSESGITPFGVKLAQRGGGFQSFVASNTAQTNLRTLLGGLGVEGGLEDLGKLDEFQAAGFLDSPLAAKLVNNILSKDPEEVGRVRGEIFGLRKKRIAGDLNRFSNQFNRSDVGENIQFLQGQQGLLGGVLKNAQDTVSNASQERNRVQNLFNEAKNDDQRAAILPKLIKATSDLRKAEDDLTVARTTAKKAAVELADAQKSQRLGLIGAIDSGNIQGIAQGLQERSVDITQTGEENERLRASGAISEAEYRLRSRRNDTSAAELARDKELFPVVEAEGVNNVALSTNKLAQFSQEAADKTQAYGDALEASTRALEDFTAATKLRALGRKGAQIAAAEEVVKAGGSVFGLGVDEDLVRGSSFFNEDARKRFELQTAQERLDAANREIDPDRVAEVEKEQKNKLIRDKNQSERNVENAPLELQRDRLQRIKDFIRSRQFLGLTTNPEDVDKVEKSKLQFPPTEPPPFKLPPEEPTAIPPLYGLPAAIGIADAPPEFEEMFGKGSTPSRVDTYNTRLLRDSTRASGVIPNAADISNIAPQGGKEVYNSIVGGLLDSSISNNVRPQSSKVLTGGVAENVVPPPGSQPIDVGKVVDAIKEVGKNIEQSVRKGIETSFGGG